MHEPITRSADETFDLESLIRGRERDNLRLHDEHINPQFAKVLRTIGFDRSYVRGQGAYLYDTEDRRVVDFLSGYGVFNMGRNHPVIRKALEDFLASDQPSLVQMDAPLLSGLLAEELKKRVPAELDKVFFTNSGTEGVEAAIKFARCATKRPRIVFCDHAFHGLSTGSLALNGEDWFREGFGDLLPECSRVPLGDLDALERELRPGDVAAFFVEPVQGKGVHIASDEYLQGAEALCRRHGTLLVADEVQSGLGRTGRFFAFEYSGITPDIVIIAKALSGGYVPCGAVITREKIYKKVFSNMERCVVHSSTFGQGAMAMVAGLATLHVLDSEKLTERAERLGNMLIEGLREIATRYEFVAEIRGRGLMVGIEFGRPKSLKLKLAWDLVHKVNAGLFSQAIVIPLFSDHGILTQVAGKDQDIIKLIPPLVVTEQDIAHFLTSFEDVIQKSHRFPGPIWEVATRLTKFAIKKS